MDDRAPEPSDIAADPGTDPMALFHAWLKDATAREPNNPTAMTLATVDGRGQPSARMVLLKGADEHGFVFYTNLESQKAQELTANPRAALLFHWKSINRQIRIEGPVSLVSDAEADAYFATRPRGAQIGAWASRQSRALETRFALEKHVAEFTAKFGLGKVPRPPFWSGYRVRPERMEFWQERPFRLHDRLVFEQTPAGGWRTEKLYP
jgi:pyridoxamine 5'-phosphate oxidase